MSVSTSRGANDQSPAAYLRQLKPYPAYKDSAIQWLGEVPVNWTVKRADAFLHYDKIQIEPSEISDELVFHYSIPSVQETGDGVLEPPSQIDSAKLKIVGPRLLVSKLNPRKGVVLVASKHDVPTLCSTEFVPFDVRGSDLRWAVYLFLGESTRQRLSAVVRSATRSHQRAEVSEITKLWHAVPALPEQRAIAAFLDLETVRIDALVAKKERLIELLQEQRTALITRAVTKGLDPTVPMKDSGVEWLGEIPVHWEVNRTKFAARLRSGHTPSRQHAEYWQDCTIPWFGLADVWQIRDGQREYVRETAEKISALGLANSAARLLPKGTVMLSRTASVGFSVIMGVDMATTQDFVNWVCGPTLRPEYLLYVFRSMHQEYRRLTMGSTHQTIYMPDVGRFATPIPPVPEQDQIVAFIRNETRKIDALVAKVRDAVKCLQELRIALISAAVTGKIDVREEGA